MNQRISEMALVFTTMAWLICLGPSALAQEDAQKILRSELSVDVLSCHDDSKLRGIILSETNQQIQLLTERNWLKQNAPAHYEQALKEEQTRFDVDRRALLDRIEDWEDQRQGEMILLDFLNEEYTRLSNGEVGVEGYPFVVLTLAKPKVRHVYRQANRNKRIAGLAWEHNLENVSDRASSDLESELKRRGVDLRTATFDLSDGLSPKLDTDEVWAARQALIEFQYLPPVEFQGTGGKLFEAGRNVDMKSVLGSMLGGEDQITRLGRELGLPEFRQREPEREQDWAKEATAAADRKNMKGVLISRLTSGLLDTNVEVNVTFHAKMPNGKWKTVWSKTSTVDSSNPDPELMAQIENDPQVKQVTGLLSQLGLGGDARMEQALAKGAATSKAINAAKTAFTEFGMSSTRKLDQPIRFKFQQ